MNERNFVIEHKGKRSMLPVAKWICLTLGILQVMIGVIGLSMIMIGQFNDSVFFLFSGAVAMGTVCVAHGWYGKSILKEKTYFSLTTEVIRFKNPSQKEQFILRRKLYDVDYGSDRLEFVMADQTRYAYDVSILSEFQVEALKSELQNIINSEEQSVLRKRINDVDYLPDRDDFEITDQSRYEYVEAYLPEFPVEKQKIEKDSSFNE